MSSHHTKIGWGHLFARVSGNGLPDQARLWLSGSRVSGGSRLVVGGDAFPASAFVKGTTA